MKSASTIGRSRLLILSIGVLFLGCRFASAESMVITEIHYNSETNNEIVEFVEIHNPGTGVVDLTSWYFSDGISYVFPSNRVLGLGEYLVVAQDPTAMSNKYGAFGLGPFDS